MSSLTLLIGYYTAVVLFYIYVRVRGKGIHAALIGLLACIPVAGLALAVAAFAAAHWRVNLREERFADVLGVISGGELLNPVDVAKEANTIPIEDALGMNDHHVRRRVVLDALKMDALDLAPLLAKAAQNEDTETSHYAVAAIMEMKRKMLAQLQKHVVAFEKRPDDRDTAAKTASILSYYLDSGLMDMRMERTYRRLMIDVLDCLIEMETAGEDHFAAKIDSEMKLARYDRARDACELFLKRYPDSEDAYYLQLKLWYATRSSAQFVATMEALKKSKIKVSHRTLNLIRYWNAGV
jgi:hypothetical protein